jgi:hypothetical protein
MFSFFHIKILLIIMVLFLILLASASQSGARGARNQIATELFQSDFEKGTYIIDTPGVYRLAEDISFNPNSAAMLGRDAYGAGFPLPEQFAPSGPYDPKAYGIGFFAAIAITAEDVVLDLAGHTIAQSEEHALLMRFFAVIELADQPFIPTQGPSDFGPELLSAKNVVIKNGTIGRSSHHGVHGNGNRRVRIENVDFRDFEVAAVALNGVNGLRIRNSTATNSKAVRVLGIWSAGLFIRPYIEYLVATNATSVLSVDGKTLDAEAVRDALKESINAVHEDLIVHGLDAIDETRHPEEYALFHNPFGVIDGNAYGYLVNGLGVAVDGFPFKPDRRTGVPARNVKLSNVHVVDQVAFINEIPAINQNGQPAIDPVGAVFQLRNRHPDTKAPITISSLDDARAVYVGNVVANAQALVAKAFLNGEFDGSPLDLSRLNITRKVLDFVEAAPGKEVLASLVPSEADYLCNGDSMFHVNKGVIAFKMDAVKGVRLNETSATGIANLGDGGLNICGSYDKSHPKATLSGYGGAAARGYTFAGSTRVRVKNSRIADLRARTGSAIGYDILTDSRKVRIENASVQAVDAGAEYAPDTDGPNGPPIAAAFRFGPDTSGVDIDRVCADDLSAFGSTAVVMDESGSADVRRLCQSAGAALALANSPTGPPR